MSSMKIRVIPILYMHFLSATQLAVALQGVAIKSKSKSQEEEEETLVCFSTNLCQSVTHP